MNSEGNVESYFKISKDVFSDVHDKNNYNIYRKI